MPTNICNGDDNTTIFDNDGIINASKRGDLELIKSTPIVAIQKAHCNVGCTALHWAAGSNQISLVHYLLSPQSTDNLELIFTDVDITVQSKLAKARTPLHYAARNGHLEMVKILIETCLV